MLPVANSYWFRESYLSKFCFIIICEEHIQKVLILNSSEKFIIFLANIHHMRFNMVNSKHTRPSCSDAHSPPPPASGQADVPSPAFLASVVAAVKQALAAEQTETWALMFVTKNDSRKYS